VNGRSASIAIASSPQAAEARQTVGDNLEDFATYTVRFYRDFVLRKQQRDTL